MLKELNIAVEDVSAITGKSSILQGRVKTLHQAVRCKLPLHSRRLF